MAAAYFSLNIAHAAGARGATSWLASVASAYQPWQWPLSLSPVALWPSPSNGINLKYQPLLSPAQLLQYNNLSSAITGGSMKINDFIVAISPYK